MARLARVSLPEVPYHITCRGNRRAPVFLAPDDRDAYIAWLGSYARRHGLEILAWCLMTNHVHLVAVPARPDSLASALGHAHGKYAQWFNARHGLSGHLWQGRYFSAALDGPHLAAAVRYVELNPVRARLAARAEDWEWSSARTHVAGLWHDDLMTGAVAAPAGGADHRAAFPEPGPAWSEWLAAASAGAADERFRSRPAPAAPAVTIPSCKRSRKSLTELFPP